MSNQILTTVTDSFASQKGVISKDLIESMIESGLKNIFKSEKVTHNTVMQPNIVYEIGNPVINPPVVLTLPPRGSAVFGNFNIVTNPFSQSFKIILNTDLILHWDGQIIEDISGRFMSGTDPGCTIWLFCGGGQTWYPLFRDRVTLAADT